MNGHHDWNPINLDLDFSDDGGFDSGYNAFVGGFNTELFTNGDLRIPPGTNLPPDPELTIISLGSEMTLHDVTLLRIEKLASLYRDLYAIPSEDYTFNLGRTVEIFAQLDDDSPTKPENTSDDLPTKIFENPSIPEISEIDFSTKGSFLWSVEHLINNINHQDLEKAYLKIQWIDFFLWLSLPDDYDRVAHVVDDLKLAYEHSLNFKTNSYHNNNHHQPMFSSIVPQDVIDAKLQTVREKVDEIGYIPKKHHTEPPPLPPLPWWIWLIIIVIIVVVIAIYLWRRVGP